MGFNPSSRVKGSMDQELNLNLNSMMDLFAVLIPALLMMSAVVEIATLNVASPAMDPENTPPPPQNDKPPLNLMVTVLESGYVLFAEGAPIGGGDPLRPNIPLVEVSVGCSRYRGTRPPPRTKNQDRAACEKKGGAEKMTFLMYDVATLASKVIELKTTHPDERRITIQPGPGVEYESIIDVMDATRDVKEESGEIRLLFDEVLISPQLL